jgi:protease-4
MTSETKKIGVIIGLILVSTFVGFYDRVQSKTSVPTSVIPKSSVMVIPIEGMISSGGSQWDSSIVDLIMNQLDQAKESKSVKAVVLRINSPGGTVGASQEIYNAILRFKSETKKPVVVSIMDIGASGAYWVALAGDYIFSHPGSIVGSLGVITQTFDLTNVPRKYNVDVRTYKAGVHKDLLNSWRKPTRDDDYIINKMLKTVHQQFKTALIENRKVTKDQAVILADGRVYAGEDALEERLVDELGGVHDAIKYAGNLVGLANPSVIYPDRGLKDWVQSLRTLFPSMGLGYQSISNVQWMH